MHFCKTCLVIMLPLLGTVSQPKTKCKASCVPASRNFHSQPSQWQVPESSTPPPLTPNAGMFSLLSSHSCPLCAVGRPSAPTARRPGAHTVGLWVVTCHAWPHGHVQESLHPDIHHTASSYLKSKVRTHNVPHDSWENVQCEASVRLHLWCQRKQVSVVAGCWVHTAAPPRAALGSAVGRQGRPGSCSESHGANRQDSDLETCQAPGAGETERLTTSPVGEALGHLGHRWRDRRTAATRTTACRFLKKLYLHPWA